MPLAFGSCQSLLSLQDHEQGDLTLLLNEKVDVGCVSRKGNCIAIYGVASKHK